MRETEFGVWDKKGRKIKHIKMELKPCPVCGRYPEFRFNEHRRAVWAVGCWFRHGDLYSNHANKEDAIKRWNNGDYGDESKLIQWEGKGLGGLGKDKGIKQYENRYQYN